MDNPLNDPRVEKGRDRLAQWHRGFPEARIGGVCAGIANQLDMPLTLVRAGFVLAGLLGPSAIAALAFYLVMWFLMPATEGAASGLDRLADSVDSLTGDAKERIINSDSDLRDR